MLLYKLILLMNGNDPIRCFISLWLYCQMMLCIHSFYDSRLLATRYLQQQRSSSSSSRGLKLFAHHNNNFDHTAQWNKKYQWDHHRPQAMMMMTKLFSTKTSNDMKAGSNGKSNTGMLKSKLTSNNNNNNNADKQQLLVKKTGAFVSKLPEVYPSPIHFKRAMRRTREIKIDSNIKNLRNANR